MSIFKKREERISFLYKYYLMDSIKEEALKDLHNLEYGFNNEQIEMIKELLNNKDMIEEQIIKYLPSDWKFSRINYLEKAILLNGASEIMIFKQKKEIATAESVKYAKKHCDATSHKMINAILDKIEPK